jgi:hypothetical protein
LLLLLLVLLVVGVALLLLESEDVLLAGLDEVELFSPRKSVTYQPEPFN